MTSAPRRTTIQLESLNVYVQNLPRSIQGDAIGIAQGLGEDRRLREIIKVWHNDTTAEVLLVAGSHPADVGAFKASVSELQARFGLRYTPGVHVQESAQHTKEQAEWFADKCLELEVKTMVLYAPSYHLLRQALTLHASLEARGLSRKVMVIPRPTLTGPHALAPASQAGETDLMAIEMVESEVGRCRKYQEGGDVASIESYLDYLRWLWEQDVVRTARY